MNRFMKKTAAAVMSLAMIASAGAAVSADVLKTVPVLSASAYGQFVTVDHVIYEVYSDHVNVAGFEAGYRNLTIRDKVQGKFVTTMDSIAFAGRNVKSVTFKTTKLITIPSGAFANCTSLVSVILPPNLREIEYRGFYNCSALQRIRFPYRMQSIGSQAFGGCTSLNEIVFRRANCTIASNAFRYNGVYAGSYGTMVYVPNNGSVKDHFERIIMSNYIVDRYTEGNVDGVNGVTVDDAQLTLQAAVEALVGNPSILTRKQEICADVDDDGEITAADAQYILNYTNESIQLGMNVYMCCILNGVNYG